jgi:hypothetical protein
MVLQEEELARSVEQFFQGHGRFTGRSVVPADAVGD